jgi:hypothetical protein
MDTAAEAPPPLPEDAGPPPLPQDDEEPAQDDQPASLWAQERKQTAAAAAEAGPGPSSSAAANGEASSSKAAEDAGAVSAEEAALLKVGRSLQIHCAAASCDMHSGWHAYWLNLIQQTTDKADAQKHMPCWFSSLTLQDPACSFLPLHVEEQLACMYPQKFHPSPCIPVIGFNCC